MAKRYPGGSVLIKVEGARLEQFMNLATGRGIELRNVERHGKGVHCWIDASDFSRLRPVARKSGCKVRIMARRGPIFLLKRFLRRKTMLLGLVLCCILVAVSASFVWFVEVQGLEKTDPEVVLEKAAELGIAPGTPIWGLDLHSVARKLERDIPALTWVGVERRGVRVLIKVVEKTREMPRQDEIVDIIAARSGVIEEMVTLSGIPMVAEGDEVKRGDILIAASDMGSPDYAGISARGHILASVWYTEKQSIELRQEIKVPTGDVYVRTILEVAGRDPVTISGIREIPFEDFEKSKESWHVFDAWDSIPLSIRVERVYYKEMSSGFRTLSEPRAIEIACARAHSRIRGQLGEDAEIKHINCDLIERRENAVVVEATVLAVESIGKEKPVEFQH